MKRIFGIMMSIAVALVIGLGTTSCQKDIEKEDFILKGHCWEGHLPGDLRLIRFSRFYFETDGTGIEEVYENNAWCGDYAFNWGWADGYPGLLVLDYGGRFGNCSYIDVTHVDSYKLDGYYYQTWDDFLHFRYDTDLSIDLRVSNAHRHQ